MLSHALVCACVAAAPRCGAAVVRPGIGIRAARAAVRATVTTRASGAPTARLYSLRGGAHHSHDAAASRQQELEAAQANLHRRYEIVSSLSSMLDQGNVELHPVVGSLTKLICTIGPASHSPEMIQKMVDEGLRVLRINCSHATREEMEERVKWLRGCSGGHGSGFNLRAIMFDTKGPEIRTGPLDAKLDLVQGEEVNLVSTANAEAAEGFGDRRTVVVDYVGIERALGESPRGKQAILLDDGLIELSVERLESAPTVDADVPVLVCSVKNSGTLGSRVGVNVPKAKLDLPAMTDLDKEHLRVAVDLDAEFVAASFVRSAEDVRKIRAYLGELHDARWPDTHPQPQIISKIESSEAMANFDEILAESDGIMVARGDLGVEIPFSVVTRAQKLIVGKCNAAGKPVIVATQMLESMIDNPRPTRAEVSDVLNAVYDGADCVMLSGESAKGRWPVESVRTLKNIARQADMSHKEYGRRPMLHASGEGGAALSGGDGDRDGKLDAVARAAVQSATEMHADLIIVITDSGFTARLLAKQRGPIPIMALVNDVKVGRQLINRGIHPVYHPDPTTSAESAAAACGAGSDAPESVATEDDGAGGNLLRQRQAVRKARELGFVTRGDTVLIVLQEPASSVMGSTFTTRVAVVR